MTPNYKPNERELIRLLSYFKKKAKTLLDENRSIEEYTPLLETGEKLVEQVTIHATNRDTVEAARQKLGTLVKDNAFCPRCHQNSHLKLIGTDKSAEGWKSNKYKCRKCNIEFVWNAPNNPWDMVPYVERFVVQTELKMADDHISPEEKEQLGAMVENMKMNLAKLKPVVEASDRDIVAIETHEVEMDALIHKFTKYLQIEKIRLED